MTLDAGEPQPVIWETIKAPRARADDLEMKWPGGRVDREGNLTMERVDARAFAEVDGLEPGERLYLTAVSIPVERFHPGPKGPVLLGAGSVGIATLPDPMTGLVQASLLHRKRLDYMTLAWGAYNGSVYVWSIPAGPAHGVHSKLFEVTEAPVRARLPERFHFLG